ncbi:MAG: complex I subunit 1 family protein [Candidatus Bathyarchaeia archaeon]
MVWEEIITVIELLVFPGFLFIFCLGLFYQWIDRKFYAKLQNRYGPLHTGSKGIYQPLADFVKLLTKEDIVPAAADKVLFTLTPIMLLAIPFTAIFCVPIIGRAFSAFEGDIIFVIFVLGIIAMLKFLAGWGSTNRFSTIGSVRAAFQLFSYEVPLTIVLFSTAMLARSLSISSIAQYVASNPLAVIVLLPGFAVALVCFVAELERVPFDIPEAEQEIVAGWLTEFTGRRLALLRLSVDVETVLAVALMAAIFLGGPYGLTLPYIPQLYYFIWFFIKATVILLVLANIRAAFARLRIDQMVHTGWKYLMVIAVLEIILVQAVLAGGIL